MRHHRNPLGLPRIAYTLGLHIIARQIHRVLDNQEQIMANFDALNAKLDEQDAARVAATDRIAEDVEALKQQIADLELDSNDQAEVDAITDRISANVEALNAIDPVKVDDAGQPAAPEAPADEPTPAEPISPTEPTDG